MRPLDGTSTRRATAADVTAVVEVHRRWAASQNGPLTRTGPRFDRPPEEVVGAVHAVTLAVDADEQVVGYAT